MEERIIPYTSQMLQPAINNNVQTIELLFHLLPPYFSETLLQRESLHNQLPGPFENYSFYYTCASYYYWILHGLHPTRSNIKALSAEWVYAGKIIIKNNVFTLKMFMYVQNTLRRVDSFLVDESIEFKIFNFPSHIFSLSSVHLTISETSIFLTFETKFTYIMCYIHCLYL